MSERVATRCDQCGQSDDHPKIHIGPVTKHHDCLSFAEKEMVVASSDKVAQIIEACEGGKRGADLLAHIQTLHQEG